MDVKMIYLHALTPVHTGTGQSADVIDLPIAREKATGWPFLPSTGLKGVWKEALRMQRGHDGDEWIKEVFGDEKQAGAFCFTDQRILCLPVRSFFGTFAYTSCPLILKRLVRDRKALGIPELLKIDGLEVPSLNALITNSSLLTDSSSNKIYLEDIDLVATKEDICIAVADSLAAALFNDEEERNTFRERFVIVSDETFNFMSETATEISAHIKLEADTKTTTTGSLRYEEAVPAETIFFGFVALSEFAVSDKQNSEDRNLNLLKGGLLQLGGKATSGRGLCRVIVEEGQ